MYAVFEQEVVKEVFAAGSEKSEETLESELVKVFEPVRRRFSVIQQFPSASFLTVYEFVSLTSYNVV